MKNKGFLTALLVFITPFLVITLSTVWYYSGLGPSGKVNYGEMITPPIAIGDLDLELNFQPLNIDTMERKWMLIHFVKGVCEEKCQQSLYFSRQINTLIGREQERVKRFLVGIDNNSNELEIILKEYPRLALIKSNNPSAITEVMGLKSISAFEQPGFFLADPLGNIILLYQGEIDPKKILSDIKKLLRASKIG